jgi:anhydro-N-acetylmuramic acid kinase
MIRTFCAFTAKSIAENLNKHLNFTTSDCSLIINGGGVYHPVLMEDIRNSTKISNIKTSAEIGIDPDMKESLLMAVLGVAKLEDIPANMPAVTGAKEMVVLGDVL